MPTKTTLTILFDTARPTVAYSMPTDPRAAELGSQWVHVEVDRTLTILGPTEAVLAWLLDTVDAVYDADPRPPAVTE